MIPPSIIIWDFCLVKGKIRSINLERLFFSYNLFFLIMPIFLTEKALRANFDKDGKSL